MRRPTVLGKTIFERFKLSLSQSGTIAARCALSSIKNSTPSKPASEIWESFSSILHSSPPNGNPTIPQYD
jgi:hypothetical protein